MDKLREKLAALGIVNCYDCDHTCTPDRTPDQEALLCPADLDQVIAIIEEEEND